MVDGAAICGIRRACGVPSRCVSKRFSMMECIQGRVYSSENITKRAEAVTASNNAPEMAEKKCILVAHDAVVSMYL